MNALLNIAKTGANPVYIDPSEITAVHYDSKTGGIEFNNSEGRFLYFKMQDWGIELADLVQKMEDHGTPLAYFPVRYDDKEYHHYIAPAAVTFISVSKSASDGKIGVIAGVRGSGREETDGMTQPELDALLKAVRGAKTMLEYTDEARSRWYEAAGLYLDPQSVVKIQDTGYDTGVDVWFDQTGRLDIKVKEIGVRSVPKEIADAMSPGDLSALFEQAKLRKEEAQKQARMDFANNLAAANGALLALPSSDRAVYMRKEDMGLVNFYDDAKNGSFNIYIRGKQTPSNSSPDPVYLYFKTTAEREAAFAVINGSASQPLKKPQQPEFGG